MILAAFFILGFGLCASGGTGASSHKKEESYDIYNNTMRVVRRNGSLHLLWYSDELKSSVAKCLRSNLLNKTKYGSRRTLEINEKQQKDDTSEQLKTNISIFVKRTSASATVTAEDDKGLLPPRWTETHDVLNATRHCFVLRAVVIQAKPMWKSECVVFGVKSSEECFEMAERDCTQGTKVNLTECEGVGKKGKRKTPK
uniref:Putative secreted protein 94 n=1 Tax=Amblyomma americanum TaxID=6943 RepID=A0A0C9SE53_AMBAM